MRLLRAGIETSMIALWLGHEEVETTHVYLHADMGIKERALAATAPAVATRGRFRPNDKLLSFLEALCPGLAGGGAGSLRVVMHPATQLSSYI